MAAIEAMAAGLPLVVSQISSLAEIMTDQEHAIFINPPEPKSIADRIQELVDNPELYDRIARDGQAFVRDKLSWVEYSRQYLEFATKEK